MGDTQSRIMNREFSRVQGLVSHSVTCITPVFLSVLFSRESALVTKNKTKNKARRIDVVQPQSPVWLTHVGFKRWYS